MSDEPLHVVKIRRGVQLHALLAIYENEHYAILRRVTLLEEGSSTWVAGSALIVPAAQLADLEAAIIALRQAVDRAPALAEEPKRTHGPAPKQYTPRRRNRK